MRDNKGFTLVELAVCMIITGILMGIVVRCSEVAQNIEGVKAEASRVTEKASQEVSTDPSSNQLNEINSKLDKVIILLENGAESSTAGYSPTSNNPYSR